MATGYYLRVRKEYGENGRWVTIKSLGASKAEPTGERNMSVSCPKECLCSNALIPVSEI
ncbi:MAG: hypothetical protein NHB15_07420 [Methanosarcina barkeri]|nr:hypothetical protein [Methanosarcina sp. ERenArc_MAG2]